MSFWRTPHSRRDTAEGYPDWLFLAHARHLDDGPASWSRYFVEGVATRTGAKVNPSHWLEPIRSRVECSTQQCATHYRIQVAFDALLNVRLPVTALQGQSFGRWRGDLHDCA